MALASYSDLQTTVLAMMARDGDTALTSYFPVAVALMEAKLNRNLRVSKMETTTILGLEGAIEYLTDEEGAVLVVDGNPTIEGTGVFDLPADFLELIRVVETTLGQPLDYVPPEHAARSFAGTPAGVPGYYSVIGSQLLTYPPNENGIELTYYAKIPGLEANSTNWLMTAYPDVYLFGALAEMYLFAENPDMATLWSQRQGTAVDEVKLTDKGRHFANAAIRTTAATP